MVAERTDEDYMRMALRQAEQAEVQNEVPVGAVAVLEREVVGRAFNQVEMLGDATAHAEMITLTQAEVAKGDWRLTDVTLYVTKEPCPMCAGAMVNCRMGRVVYGCADPEAGAAGSALNITDFSGSVHTVAVTSGILTHLCSELLVSFFQEKRRKKTKEDSLDGGIEQ